MRMVGRSVVVWMVLLVVGLGCRTGPGSDAGAEALVEHSVEESGGATESGEAPKRIILFIGDGMGLSSVAAAAYSSPEPLAMMGMSEFGLMATHGYEAVTTDSAASATAMATGEKTHFNGVSIRATREAADEEDEINHQRTLVGAAKEAGYRTGLIAPVRITHATPAAFSAHRYARSQYEDIAADMAGYGLDVLLGAGSRYFASREDGRDLLAELEAEGVVVAGNAGAVREAKRSADRLVGLMHERDMPFAATGERAMELDEMVDVALHVLDRGEPEGFFLMVEGAFIDWAGHALDGGGVVSETRDMDRALARALEYASGRDDTVVIVTADHETGGMDLVDGAWARQALDVLGGEEAAYRMTVPDSVPEERLAGLSPPFEFLEAGGRFGPAGLAEFTTSFGFFSPASRGAWDGGRFFSAMHTPLFVPIFAEGSGAREAAMVRDNADLGRLMLSWIDDRRSLDEPELRAPRNVVLFVSDGLGIGSLTAGYYHFGRLAMWEMARVGALWTHGEEALIPEREEVFRGLVSEGLRGSLEEAGGALVVLAGGPDVEEVVEAWESLEEERGEGGFLLVVRGAELESLASEFEEGPGIMERLREFDEAVGAVRARAAERGDTLVLVTSTGDLAVTVMDDHYAFQSGRCAVAVECGGAMEFPWMPVAWEKVHRGEGLGDQGFQQDYGPPRVALQYTWLAQEARRQGEAVRSPRAANFVPLFAEGPGQEDLGRVMGYEDLGRWLQDQVTAWAEPRKR